MNLSRYQLFQFFSEIAFGSGGRRRFLLSSDTDGRTWVTVAALFLVATIGVGLVPVVTGKGHVPDPTSLDPGFGSVVSISSADDCDVRTFDVDTAGAPVDTSDCPIESVASNHLSESSDKVSAAVGIASTILDVKKDRSFLQVDTPAFVSEPECSPPTLPDCEPCDDEFLDPESSFSSVNLQRDPGLVHARPHSVSVDPFPGLLPGFCFLSTEIDDSGYPVVDSLVGLSAPLDSLDNAQKVSLGCGLFRKRH